MSTRVENYSLVAALRIILASADSCQVTFRFLHYILSATNDN